MRVGINTLGLEPLIDEEDVYLRHILSRMGAIQPETHFTVFTDASNHSTFPEWDRVMVGMDGARNLSQAIKQAQANLVFTPLHTATMVGSFPFVALSLDADFTGKSGDAITSSEPLTPRELRKVSKRAVAMVVPSESLRRQLLYELGVPIDRVVVAKPGVNEIFEKPATCIAEEPFLLTVLESRYRHGLPILLDASERLLDTNDHCLVIVGRPQRNEPHDWGSRVLRIDHCGATQLAGLYQHCAAFVCSSLHEGGTIALLQAMRAGARIVAARTGVIEEFAGTIPLYYNRDNIDSLVSTIRRAMTEPPDVRHGAVEYGRRRAAEYSWDDTAWRTLLAFKRL
jgi:glycosyltransferase involved in cell wall biosynthesis